MTIHLAPHRWQVPKYALVDPLDANVVNGRVKDAGFSPEPYAAGVPLLLHAEDCSHLLGERTMPSRAASLSLLERLPPRLQHSISLEWLGPVARPRRTAAWTSLETLHSIRHSGHDTMDELAQPHAEAPEGERAVERSAPQLAETDAARGRAQMHQMPHCPSSPKMSRSSSTLSVDEKLSLYVRSSASKLSLEAAVAAAAAARSPSVSVSPLPGGHLALQGTLTEPEPHSPKHLQI